MKVGIELAVPATMPRLCPSGLRTTGRGDTAASPATRAARCQQDPSDADIRLVAALRAAGRLPSPEVRVMTVRPLAGYPPVAPLHTRSARSRSRLPHAGRPGAHGASRRAVPRDTGALGRVASRSRRRTPWRTRGDRAVPRAGRTRARRAPRRPHSPGRRSCASPDRRAGGHGSAGPAPHMWPRSCAAGRTCSR